MRNQQVPRPEWLRFFSDFTRRHEHELASVILTDEKIGAQHIASDVRFEGFVSDPLGTRISVLLGGSPESNLDHPVDFPSVVWIEHDERGREVAVQIESGRGQTTILEFRAAAQAGAREESGSGRSS